MFLKFGPQIFEDSQILLFVRQKLQLATIEIWSNFQTSLSDDQHRILANLTLHNELSYSQLSDFQRVEHIFEILNIHNASINERLGSLLDFFRQMTKWLSVIKQSKVKVNPNKQCR